MRIERIEGVPFTVRDDEEMFEYDTQTVSGLPEHVYAIRTKNEPKTVTAILLRVVVFTNLKRTRST